MTSDSTGASAARKPSRLDVLRHAKSLFRPMLLRNWYRHYFPVEVRFFDGQERLTRRAIRRMFQYWLKAEGSTNEIRSAYEAYAGGDFLDVGASNGFYSMALASKARAGTRMLSLEPYQPSQATLLETLGEAKRLFPDVDFAMLPNALGEGQTVQIQDEAKAVASYGDHLVKAIGLKLSFLKIDVEGYEFSVLRGLKESLREFKPGIMLEIHPVHLQQVEEATPDEVDAFLRDCGYTTMEKIDYTDLSWRQLWS